MGVAAALDALKWKEILGSIAGDDTVMCVARDAEQAEIVAEKLKGILNYVSSSSCEESGTY